MQRWIFSRDGGGEAFGVRKLACAFECLRIASEIAKAEASFRLQGALRARHRESLLLDFSMVGYEYGEVSFPAFSASSRIWNGVLL